jgi:hypothetical protein
MNVSNSQHAPKSGAVRIDHAQLLLNFVKREGPRHGAVVARRSVPSTCTQNMRQSRKLQRDINKKTPQNMKASTLKSI